MSRVLTLFGLGFGRYLDLGLGGGGGREGWGGEDSARGLLMILLK